MVRPHIKEADYYYKEHDRWLKEKIYEWYRQ